MEAPLPNSPPEINVGQIEPPRQQRSTQPSQYEDGQLRQPVELLNPFTEHADPVYVPCDHLEGDSGVFDTDRITDPKPLLDKIVADHANYYSAESLTWLAGGFGVGAVMANTSIDQNIQSHFQSSVRGASSDEWFETLRAPRELGNGLYTLPVFAAAWAVGGLFEGTPIADTTGEWGERSLRAILVGAPPMLAMQYVTGGSRPGESSAGSKWKLLRDNNGVSGHSFMGAVPFLAAAKMTEEPLLKFAYYAGSAFVPLSRINDSAHYPSQALLGWWMAWIATNAVDATQDANRNWSLIPLPDANASGVAVEYRW